MTQTPINVTYSLESFLEKLEQKIDKRFDDMDRKIDYKFDEVNRRIDKLSEETNQKFNNLSEETAQKFKQLSEEFTKRFDKIDERLNKLEVGQGKIEEKVEGLSKRVDFQEFINRGVLLALVVTILGGFAKFLGIIGNP